MKAVATSGATGVGQAACDRETPRVCLVEAEGFAGHGDRDREAGVEVEEVDLFEVEAGVRECGRMAGLHGGRAIE